MRLFLTGSTGLIGKRLIARLRERGDSIVLVTRRASVGRDLVGQQDKVVEGDVMNPGAWMDAVRDCDGAINLAGEGITRLYLRELGSDVECSE